MSFAEIMDVIDGRGWCSRKFIGKHLPGLRYHNVCNQLSSLVARGAIAFKGPKGRRQYRLIDRAAAYRTYCPARALPWPCLSNASEADIKRAFDGHRYTSLAPCKAHDMMACPACTRRQNHGQG